jgi:SM-20-related protein
MSAREAIIQVLDAPLSDDVCHGVTEAVAQKRWYFGNASVVGEDPGFWKMDLDGEPALDALWGALRAPCEELARARLTVIRQYANGHTYGLGGRTHADWGGETVFHRTNGDIALAVLPKPKRAILFDARIPHEGRAPSRNFGGLRVTIAFKLGPAGEPK